MTLSKNATFLKLVAFSSLLVCASASADWQLLNKDSQLNFISTKNIKVSEIHHFSNLSGSLTSAGELSVDIDLASVETGIDIRNSRMREKLFMVENFPKAMLTASLPKEIVAFTKGQAGTFTIPAKLSVLGQHKDIEVKVQVTKTDHNRFVATSVQPVMISAGDYGLQEGIDWLQNVAGLSSISPNVPVTFNLTFIELM
ncbi:YceI protein [Paraglaciecola mesophila KMM 241]|uniref:YceI protein n=1 Tax=Paraglaciecola mesophila KMM 241 TaxID=1128912 RepID=K6YN47_9ALTE|nr:YceI family protein [Paraglaciecola mesophila]GAC25401.1 YceI protein [Paraglaciecola mesophila KMM 241]